MDKCYFCRLHKSISLHLVGGCTKLVLQLQVLLDTNRINAKKPQLCTLRNTGLVSVNPSSMEFGFQLTGEEADKFKSEICIQVQHAKEAVIAAIERNGGVIITSYYDTKSLHALKNPAKCFEKGIPIPKRLLPPQDAVGYYTSAENRGYLADPQEISKHRLVLAQNYGYGSPNIETHPGYEMLTSRKDARQLFYGLEPGWVISLNIKR